MPSLTSTTMTKPNSFSTPCSAIPMMKPLCWTNWPISNNSGRPKKIMTLNLNPNSLEDMTMVSPSLLSADFANLQRDIEMLNQSECDWFHLDVMDGVFVPNISFGFPVMQAMARHAEKPLDVHLMIVQPEKFIPEVKALGARVMNVHYEACTHLHRVVQAIKAEGMLAGVTLNPHTPVSVLEEIASDLDLVMLMSVNPGFGGQKFIASSVEKVRKLRALLDRTGSKALIEVDGGVNRDTGRLLVDAGADVLVAGSAVFNAPNPQAEIAALRRL